MYGAYTRAKHAKAAAKTRDGWRERLSLCKMSNHNMKSVKCHPYKEKYDCLQGTTLGKTALIIAIYFQV